MHTDSEQVTGLRPPWLPPVHPVGAPYLEVALVLLLSLGKSAYYSVLSLLDKLTRPEPLNQQVTSLNNTVIEDRAWLDFGYQFAGVIFPMVPALLALYLLWRSYGRCSVIGFDLQRPVRDLLHAFAILVVIGGGGIVIYVLATQWGINSRVDPSNLSAQWWTIPLYIALAWMNGFLEEIIMIGFLAVRLTEKRWRAWQWIAVSALIRGTYHLYQGLGAFVGNLIMGVLLGWYFHRTKRVMPLVLAHFLIDAVIFVGYPLVKPYWSWLP